ncbi:MAG: hypothetical protein ABRQ37_17625 [Candidatus Eremiobacterota bacterium]
MDTKFCEDCGEKINARAEICPSCRSTQYSTTGSLTSVPLHTTRFSGSNSSGAMRKNIPMCRACGYVGHFKQAPLLQSHDIIIILLLFLLFGAGFIYLLICLLSPKPLICPNCQAKNTFTYIY